MMIAGMMCGALPAQETPPTQDTPPTQEGTAATAPENPSVWTNAEGRELQADFVRLTEEAVVLRLKSDGREVSIPLSTLSIDSHLQAVKLANPAAFSKPVPKAEEKQAATIDLPEINITAEEMLESPFPEETTLEQFLEIVKSETEAGNAFVGWHAMPPKMQTDIEDVIVRGVEKIGPSTLKQIQILMGDLHTIVTEKKDFIFGNPAIASEPQLKSVLQDNWPLLSGLVGALTEESHWQADNFKKGNVTPWMANLTAAVLPYALKAFEVAAESAPPGLELGDPLSMEYKIISQSTDTAEVEITSGGAPAEVVRFQKVGNLWIVPKDMNELRRQLDAAQAALDKDISNELGMVRTTLGGVIAAVGGLARSSTQEEFDLAVENLTVIAEGLQQSMGGGFPGALPGAGPPSAAPSGR